MTQADMQAGIQQMQEMVQPWHQSLQEPAAFQEKTLQNLLQIYAQLQDGKAHHAEKVGNYRDFVKAYPVRNYEDFQPTLQKVMEGETSLLLNEAPVGWAITRGTTKGEYKFIPMTPTDLKMRVAAARAVVNYALTAKRFDIFSGVNLNLNFPSKIGSIKAGDREVDYGYSSGIYTKYVSTNTAVNSVPSQDEIDALGGGKTRKDWDTRFDLAYKKCMEQNVTLVGGVAPTAIQFGRYTKREYNQYPKDIWKVIVMTLGSVPGINTRLSASLNALYGNAAVREIYGATEGMFGQQLDKHRAWSPNYDMFFFEVKVGDKIIPLYEMKREDIGSLIVSTPILPRYEIGDLILAFKAPYFRTIGRKDWLTPFKYVLYEFSTLNLGRL